MSVNAEKKALCPKCRHNVSNSGGACATTGLKMIENIAEALEIDDLTLDNAPIDLLKQTCKVLKQNPEDYDTIDPFNCKYYMSAALKFF